MAFPDEKAEDIPSKKACSCYKKSLHGHKKHSEHKKHLKHKKHSKYQKDLKWKPVRKGLKEGLGKHRRQARIKKKPFRPPRQKATVKQLAQTERPRATSGLQQEEQILIKIKKCIERANHPSTTESEAKAALFLSSKLMSQYDVTHADLIARESEDNRMKFAGNSIVQITSTKGEDHRVIFEGFVSTVALAVDTFFNCKSYSTRRKWSIEWTFYGILEHTISAAMAFEMVHNKILHWAGRQRGRSTVFSYCKGVADGLYNMAKEEKRLEEEAAHQAEQARLVEREREEKEQRQRELDRLNKSAPDISNLGPNRHTDGSTSGAPEKNGNRDGECNTYHAPIGHFGDDNPIGDNEFDENDLEPDFAEDSYDLRFDPKADLDDEIDRILKRKRDLEGYHRKHIVNHEKDKENPPPSFNQTNNKTTAPSTEQEDAEYIWESRMQLVLFRQNAEKIADDYLKEQNIRLTNRKRKHTSVKDLQAYEKGKEDSKKIDVRQRRIKKTSKEAP